MATTARGMNKPLLSIYALSFFRDVILLAILSQRNGSKWPVNVHFRKTEI